MSYCQAIETMQPEDRKALHKTTTIIIMVFRFTMMMNCLEDS